MFTPCTDEGPLSCAGCKNRGCERVVPLSSPFRKFAPMALVFLMVVAPIMASATPMTVDQGPAPMTSSRAITLTRMTIAAPTIDGLFASTAEWSDAQIQDYGIGGHTAKLYLMADGEYLYVLLDIVSNTDINVNDIPPPPAGAAKDYTVMIWDGNGDNKITYVANSAGSTSISSGGKNADWGFILWGNNVIWNSPIATQGTSIIFNPGAGGNTAVAATLSSTPNSVTPHRVFEYSIPYDGINDEMGGTIGYSYTKGFSVQSIDNITGTATDIGHWPSTYTAGTTWETVNLPQKYPHIKKILSPKDGATFETGQDIRFEMDATDNSMSTLVRTLILNTKNYDMGSNNYLVKNDLTPGEYNVSFKIQDDEGLSDSLKLGKIIVAEAEVPPVIGSSAPTNSNQEINEGQNMTFSVNWHDLNLDQINESVTKNWTVNDKQANPAWLTTFAFNKTYYTSNLTFKSDYTGTYSAGTFTIKLRLTDSYFSAEQSVERSWVLTVNNVNRPPRIFNTVPETSAVVTRSEEQSQVFTIEKSDPDNTALSVTWYINGTVQPDFKDLNSLTFNANPPKYDLAGKYVIKVVVSDGPAPGGLSDTVQWNLTVTNVNRAPTFSTLDPSEDQVDLKEGQSTDLTFTASDPDQDDLTFKWAINGVQQTTGTGTSGDFNFQTNYLSADGRDASKSPYFISVNVSDGLLSIEHEWKIVVENVNRPPVVVIDRPAEGKTVLIGVEVNFKALSSSDPDGDLLTFSWDFGDKKTDMKAEVNHAFAESGKYKVTLSVSDGHVTVTRYVNVTVVIPILKLVDVAFTPNPAKEGDVVTINIEIKNTGNADAINVKVKFYLGTPSPTNLLSDKVIDNISKGSIIMANTTWVANKPGNMMLTAVIDESTAYQIDGRSDKNVVISVQAKPKPPVKNPMANPVLLGGIVGGVAVAGILGFVLYKRKKDADAKEDAAVKAIIDSKTKPAEYTPVQAEASPFDKTDFKFGATTAEARSCRTCGKTTHNASGLCDDCTITKRAKEAKKKMMACPVCGNEVSRDMFTCPYCHFNFSKADKGEVEEVEKRHEAVGYVSDDACADCGVLFNDNMTVLKCPSCQATYHTRCATRLESCAECNATLTSGQTKLFKAPAPKEPELAETITIEPEEPRFVAPKEEHKVEKPQGPVCPKCGEDIEEGWKTCPGCDASLVQKSPEPDKQKVKEPTVPKVVEKLEMAPGLTKCPKCGDEVEPDWKVCPSCDAPLVSKPALPPKPVEKTVAPPKHPEVKKEAAAPGKCPKCGEDVEPDWKACPSCDAPLAVKAPTKPPEVKPPEVKKEEIKKDDEAGKKRIVWSKTAKDKALSKDHVAPKEETPKIDPKPELKKPDKPPEDTIKSDLEALAKDIEKLEKSGKDVKKAKSLVTLASSFLKGKQPDKAKIYLERSKVELQKL